MRILCWPRRLSVFIPGLMSWSAGKAWRIPSLRRMANCRTYEMWKGLNDLISDYFGKITLADLALPDQAGNDYVI